MKAIKEKFKNGNLKGEKKWEDIEAEYLNLILPVCEDCQNKITDKQNCGKCSKIGYDNTGFLLSRIIAKKDASTTDTTIVKLLEFLIDDIENNKGVLKDLLISEEFDYNKIKMVSDDEENKKLLVLLFPKLVLKDYYFTTPEFKECISEVFQWINKQEFKSESQFPKDVYKYLSTNKHFKEILKNLNKNINNFDVKKKIYKKKKKIAIKDSFCNINISKKWLNYNFNNLESLVKNEIDIIVKNHPDPDKGRRKILSTLKHKDFLSLGNHVKRIEALQKNNNNATKDSLRDLIKVLYPSGNFAIKVICKTTEKEIENEIKKLIAHLFDNTLLTFLYKNIFNYTTLQKMHGGWFADKLGIKACPYCNNQWVLSVDKDDKGKLKPKYELDHIKPKSIFPHLAISLYNLVPSCRNCNLAKGDSYEDFFNPYSESFHDNAKFKLLNNNNFIYYLSNKETIENSKLSLSCTVDKKKPDGTDNLNYKTDSQKVENHKKKFALDEIYTLHKDIIEEIYAKRYIYKHNNTWRDKIKKMLEGFDKTINGKNLDHEIDRFIYGTYTKSSDFHKRIHTKLHNDIIEELEKFDISRGTIPKSV
ncbi:HNH endonuclease [Bernardetia sp. OM2101]|uniref:HNH endonuclease n=1 Tax=Bernardetia sp. OM2101 TaxID=3344876 RepID=UPI0035CF5F3F